MGLVSAVTKEKQLMRVVVGTHSKPWFLGSWSHDFGPINN